MNKKNLRANSKPKRPNGHSDSRHKNDPSETFWNRRRIWLAGAATVIFTGVISGVAVNILTPQAQKMISASGGSSKLVHLNSMPNAPSSTKSPAGQPLAILAENPIDVTGVWVFPGKLTLKNSQLNYLNSLDMDSLSGEDALGSWFIEHGAYSPNEILQLVLRNNRSYLVRILDIAVVKSCGAPLNGTVFYSPAEGAVGDLDLYFDLDSNDMNAQNDPENTNHSDFFSNQTVTIDPGAEQVFKVWAATREHACSFFLQAEILDGSRIVFEKIGDGQQPFHVTAAVVNLSSSKPYTAYQAAYPGVDYGSSLTRPGSVDYEAVNPKTFAYKP
ncbi:MAG: hypothetical protein ACLPKE_27295 [Streptosporangiaceae bacterium]